MALAEYRGGALPTRRFQPQEPPPFFSSLALPGGWREEKKKDERQSQELNDPHSCAAHLDDKAVLEGGLSDGGAATCWITGGSSRWRAVATIGRQGCPEHIFLVLI